VSIPISPVVLVDPSSDPHRLVPQGWWLYQARRVNTSGGAGALVIRISINPGQVARLVRMYAIGPLSAGSTLAINTIDEDGGEMGLFGYAAAGATRNLGLPSIGASAAHGTVMNSVDALFGPGSYLVTTASASLATETLTVGIALLLSAPDIPIWDITGSVGGSALADSTISAANELQKVDLPW